MNDATKQALTKVPAVTLGFWVIKILATTLGETGGDTVTMSMNLGYLVGTAIFTAIFAAAVFGDEEDALRERAPAFALDATSFRWRDQEAPPPRLVDVRSSLFHSIGTCSFFEPVEELLQLGVL